MARKIICNVCWGDLRVRWWDHLSKFLDMQQEASHDTPTS